MSRSTSIFLILFAGVIAFQPLSAQEKDPPKLFRGGLIKRLEGIQEKLAEDRKKRQQAREKQEREKKELERREKEAKERKPTPKNNIAPAIDPPLQPTNSSRQLDLADAPQNARLASSRRPEKVSLGIVIEPGSVAAPGLKIVEITPNGPAARAGLKVDDRIVSLGSSPIKKAEDLSVLLDAFEWGDRTEIEWIRKGKKSNALIEFPAAISSPRNSSNPGVDSEELPNPTYSNQQPNLPEINAPAINEPASNNATNQIGNRTTAKVPGPQSGLGVTAISVDPLLIQREKLSVRQGAFLESVAKGSAAEKAGLKDGDVIIAVDGRRIDSATGLLTAIQTYQPGNTPQILFYRGRQLKRTGLTLTSIPKPEYSYRDPNAINPNGINPNAANPNGIRGGNNPSILGELAGEFPRLRRIEQMVDQFIPNEPAPNQGGVQILRTPRPEGFPPTGNATAREQALQAEVRSLQDRLQSQNQQIKTLTEKLNAIEKLLGQRKN